MRPTLTVNDVFGTRGRIEVLRVLWGVSVPLTPAEVARRTRMTHPAVTDILRSLTTQGLVGRAPAGRGHTYWVVRENVYVERFLAPVFPAEQDVPDQLLNELRELLEPGSVSVVLFGSYARGDQSIESDVDVAVVVEDSAAKSDLEDRLAACSSQFRRRFGATLAALLYDRIEACQLSERAPDLWGALVNEGVHVSGLGVDEWVRDE